MSYGSPPRERLGSPGRRVSPGYVGAQRVPAAVPAIVIFGARLGRARVWFGCAVSPKSLQCAMSRNPGNVHCFERATQRTHTNASEAPTAFDELFGVAPTSPSAHVQLISPDL